MVAATLSLFTFSLSAATSQSYVQNGLVAQWDGIENIGVGQHDDAAKFWADLTGNGHNLTNFNSGLSWKADSLVMPTANYGLAATLVGSVDISMNGNPRIQFQHVDIGCYENHSGGFAIIIH